MGRGGPGRGGSPGCQGFSGCCEGLSCDAEGAHTSWLIWDELRTAHDGGADPQVTPGKAVAFPSTPHLRTECCSVSHWKSLEGRGHRGLSFFFCRRECDHRHACRHGGGVFTWTVMVMGLLWVQLLLPSCDSSCHSFIHSLSHHSLTHSLTH